MNKTVTLDEDQINYLFDFVRSKYVRYIDVQHELVDHLASAIEDEMEKDERISFRQALDNVYSGFPITGFAMIISAKEKALTRYWWKMTLKYLLEFISIPKVMITFILFLLLSGIMSFYGKNAVIVFTSLLLGFSILLIFRYKRFFKYIDKRQNYLFISAFETSCNVTNFSTIYMLWHVLSSSDKALSVFGAYILSAMFCILFMYMYASYNVFPYMLKREVNLKYRHLHLKFGL